MSATAATTTGTKEDYYTSSTKAKQEEAASTKKSNKVSHDDFLRLLVTQMQNQDPLEPMENTEQMAQFAQLQQLDNQQAMTEAMVSMRKEYAVQGATSMIGKQITTTDDSGANTTGIVLKVQYEDAEDGTTGDVTLLLDTGKTAKYSEVTKVEDVVTPPSIQEASALMGKYVVGAGSDGKAYEGIVKNVTTQGNIIYVETYEGDTVPVDGIAQVRELTSSEKKALEDAQALINCYIEAPDTSTSDTTDKKTGVVKDVYRKDGQYWAETWGGTGIYIKDITTSASLNTDQMLQMEECKKYVERFVKFNDGKAAGIAEGFFFQNDQFYLYTAKGEALSLDSVYSARNASTSDVADYGTTNGMSELQILNLNKAVKEMLGTNYTGFDTQGNQNSGTITSIYYRDGLILFGLGSGKEAVSPASLAGV